MRYVLAFAFVCTFFVLVDAQNNEAHCSDLLDKDFSDLSIRSEQSMWVKCMIADSVPGTERIAGAAYDLDQSNNKSDLKAKLDDILKNSRAGRANFKHEKDKFDEKLREMQEARQKMDKEREEQKKKQEALTRKARQEIEEKQKKNQAAAVKAELKKKINAELRNVTAEYHRTGNATQRQLDIYNWRVKWNKTMTEVFENSSLPISARIADRMKQKNYTVGDLTKEEILIASEKMVRVLNDTITRSREHRAAKHASKNTTASPTRQIADKFVQSLNDFRSKTVPEHVQAQGWRGMMDIVHEATHKAVTSIRPLADRALLAHQRSQRSKRARQRTTDFFFNTAQRSKYHSTKLKTRPGKRGWGYFHINTTESVKAFTKRTGRWKLSGNDTTFGQSMATFMKTYQDKARKFGAYSTNGSAVMMEFGLSTVRAMNPELHDRIEPHVRKVHRVVSNATFWARTTEHMTRIGTIMQTGISEIQQVAKHGKSGYMPGNTRAYFHNTIKPNVFSRMAYITGEADAFLYTVPMWNRVERFIDFRKALNSTIEFFSGRFRNCTTDPNELVTSTGKICFPPYLNQNWDGFPLLVTNITTSLFPIDCDAFAQLNHGSTNFFTRIFILGYEFLSFIVTYIPGSDVFPLSLFRWSDTDPRRGLSNGVRVVFCDTFYFFLFLLFLYIAVLALGPIFQAITATTVQARLSANEIETGKNTQHIAYNHPGSVLGYDFNAKKEV